MILFVKLCLGIFLLNESAEVLIMQKYIMALDQGTTSSRCILFDEMGSIRSMAQQEFEQIYPNPGWVEQNPREIWSSQLAAAVEAMGRLGITIDEVAGIGITNQRETTIVWDKKTGQPVYNAIVWQCRRTSDMIEKLCSDGLKEYVRTTTGLIPDAYFSASKIAWILENVEGVREKADRGELAFGTVDSWLIWNLTKGRVHATDYTNASRTMLFDIHNLKWDEKLLEYFKIPKEMLPEVKPSSCLFGNTEGSVIGGSVPIGGVAGDQQSALFGQCCFERGDVKNTYGTGSFILMNTGKEAVNSKNGLLTTIAAGCDNNVDYALEGSVFVAGAAVQWLRDGIKIIKNAAESETLATSVEDSNGVYIVPAFTGLGAPYWNPYARGTVFGLTRGVSRGHFVRAMLESIAYQTNDVINAMEEDAGARLGSLKVDGGASANNFLMQFQSDITNTKVMRPETIETTALGAAYLAGLSTGYFGSKEEIKRKWAAGREFTPSMDDGERDERLAKWKLAVKCSMEFR